MAISSLLVPAPQMIQPDTSWLKSLAGSVMGSLDQASKNRSWNGLDEQFGRMAQGQPLQPQAPAGGLISRLLSSAQGSPEQPAQSPGINAAPPIIPVERGEAQGSTYRPFIDTVRSKVTNPYGLSAVAATGRAESQWSGENAGRTWSDPSQSGQAGTSGGIMSWRGPRLASLQSYAASKGEQGNGSPATQAEFFLQEDPTLVDRLNQAQSPQGAADLMAGAWKFAGHDQQGGEAARRRALAQNYYATEFGNAGASAPQAGGNAALAAIEKQAPGGMGSPLTEQAFDSRFGPSPLPVDQIAGRDDLTSRLSETNAQPSTPMPSSGFPISSNRSNFGPYGPQPTGQPANPTPGQPAVQGYGNVAPPNGSQPLGRGEVPSDLIRFMLKDPNLRDMGVQLWKQNSGKASAEPFQVIRGADGSLIRFNQQTGASDVVGNFGKDLNPTALMQNLEAAGLQPGTPEYREAVMNGTKRGLTINTGENRPKFIEESDKAAAGRFNDILEGGNAAPQMMEDLQTLASLGQQIGTGKTAQVMNMIGPYAEALGVDIAGLGEMQAYQAVVNRIAPQMRPAGSGATSDFDAKQFLTSLPKLANTPEGNALISSTFRKVQENKLAAAEIASKAYLSKEEGGISWQEAEKQIRKLANPYSDFRKARTALLGDGPQSGKGSRTGASPPPSGGPVTVRTADDYNALPSGAQYSDPNGNLRTKP